MGGDEMSREGMRKGMQVSGRVLRVLYSSTLKRRGLGN